MAFLAIPAVTSGLATVFGSTAAPIISAALSGAAAGGVGNKLAGGDWKRGAAMGALGGAGGAGASALFGGGAGAGSAIGAAADVAGSDLAGVGAGALGSAAAEGATRSAISSFLGDAARQGASNVAGQALIHAATPKRTMTTPSPQLEQINIPDPLWEDLIRRNMSLG